MKRSILVLAAALAAAASGPPARAEEPVPSSIAIAGEVAAARVAVNGKVRVRGTFTFNKGFPNGKTAFFSAQASAFDASFTNYASASQSAVIKDGKASYDILLPYRFIVASRTATKLNISVGVSASNTDVVPRYSGYTSLGRTRSFPRTNGGTVVVTLNGGL